METKHQSSVYVVVGMHKSGTTLVAQILNGSGVEMWSEPISGNYDRGQKGECKRAKEINNRVLQSAGARSVAMRSPAKLENVRMEDMEDGYEFVKTMQGRSRDWGFKDPRTTLTYCAYWKHVLPPHRVIAIFRSPQEVVAHYTKGQLAKLGFGCRALAAWSIHNRELLRILRSQPEAILVRYESLMAGREEFQRLAHFLNSGAEDPRIGTLHRAHTTPRWYYRTCHLFVRLFFGLVPDADHDSLLRVWNRRRNSVP